MPKETLEINGLKFIVSEGRLTEYNISDQFNEIFVLASLLDYELYYEMYKKSIWIWFVKIKKRFCLALDYDNTVLGLILDKITLRIDSKSNFSSRGSIREAQFQPLKTLKELL